MTDLVKENWELNIAIEYLRSNNERLRAALRDMISVVDVSNPSSDPAIATALRILEER